jgi:formylmethanofuran dehydrogenase subunit E
VTGIGSGGIVLGAIALVAGIALVVIAARKTKQETAQNITLKVDLPGETKIEQVKCRSCGGTLTADNIKLVNGAPMVNCPYCNTVYQLTEEPKW